jgi:hypothetical protein
MGRSKNNIAINTLVLIIASFYFLVAVSHISFLKNSTRGDRKSRIHTNSVFKRKADIFYSKVDNVSLIKLLDKTTVEQKNSFNDLIKSATECFVCILFILAIWQLKPRFCNLWPSWQVIHYRDHYLSICTLKI